MSFAVTNFVVMDFVMTKFRGDEWSAVSRITCHFFEQRYQPNNPVRNSATKTYQPVKTSTV